jgi:hypothetical protein
LIAITMSTAMDALRHFCGRETNWAISSIPQDLDDTLRACNYAEGVRRK